MITILNFGSPRGYSTKITKDINLVVLTSGANVSCYNLYTYNIEYCENCGYCSKQVGCMFKDNYLNIVDSINKSDLIINVIPMYHAQPSARYKTFLDRAQCIYHSKYTHNNSLIDRDKIRRLLNVIVCGDKYNQDDTNLMLHCMKHFERNFNCKALDNICLIDNTDTWGYSEKTQYDLANTIQELIEIYK